MGSYLSTNNGPNLVGATTARNTPPDASQWHGVLYLTMAIDMNPRDGVAHIIRIVRRQSGMIGRELHIAMDQGNQTMGERRKRGPSIARHR